MKTIKVTAINNKTLKLEEDGKKGDIINLDEITKIDTEIINKQIDAKKDEIYNKKLSDLLATIEKEKK